MRSTTIDNLHAKHEIFLKNDSNIDGRSAVISTFREKTLHIVSLLEWDEFFFVYILNQLSSLL